MNLLTSAQKLFVILACLIISSGCQSDLVQDKVAAKPKDPFVTNHNPEPESNNKTSQVQKSESDKPNMDKELAFSNNEKSVYLTFDDGPTSATSDILDILQQFNAKATFFMLEPAMRELPETLDKIVEAGHAVGLHGVTHNKNHFYKSEQSALEEMISGQETLEQMTGIQSYLIRTPYGSVPYLTESYRAVLDSNGFKLWDWNVDSSDWSLSSDQYVNTVIKQIEELVNAEVVPIILMHDKQNTANHLSILLTYLSEHGFQTKKIEENIVPYNFSCYDRCIQLSIPK